MQVAVSLAACSCRSLSLSPAILFSRRRVLCGMKLTARVIAVPSQVFCCGCCCWCCSLWLLLRLWSLAAAAAVTLWRHSHIIYCLTACQASRQVGPALSWVCAAYSICLYVCVCVRVRLSSMSIAVVG